jgi:hypothetical protein
MIPGMAKPILLVFPSFCGFSHAKRTAKIGTASKLPSVHFKKIPEFIGAVRLSLRFDHQ